MCAFFSSSNNSGTIKKIIHFHHWNVVIFLVMCLETHLQHCDLMTTDKTEIYVCAHCFGNGLFSFTFPFVALFSCDCYCQKSKMLCCETVTVSVWMRLKSKKETPIASGIPSIMFCVTAFWMFSFIETVLWEQAQEFGSKYDEIWSTAFNSKMHATHTCFRTIKLTAYGCKS